MTFLRWLFGLTCVYAPCQGKPVRYVLIHGQWARACASCAAENDRKPLRPGSVSAPEHGRREGR